MDEELEKRIFSGPMSDDERNSIEEGLPLKFQKCQFCILSHSEFMS